jgi:hypothetical protein
VAAVAVVLAAVAVESVGSFSIAGFVSGGYVTALLVNTLVAALLVRAILRVLGYEISTTGAMFALLAGTASTYVLTHALLVNSGRLAPTVLPSTGVVTALPSVLLSAWLVQQAAVRARRVRH